MGLQFIEDHSCGALSKMDDIAVEQYEHNGAIKWFWRFKKQMHQICFCPYCGDKLERGDT